MVERILKAVKEFGTAVKQLVVATVAVCVEIAASLGAVALAIHVTRVMFELIVERIVVVGHELIRLWWLLL